MENARAKEKKETNHSVYAAVLHRTAHFLADHLLYQVLSDLHIKLSHFQMLCSYANLKIMVTTEMVAS